MGYIQNIPRIYKIPIVRQEISELSEAAVYMIHPKTIYVYLNYYV